MSTAPGLLTALVLLAIGLLHVYWALSGPMASAAAVPSIGGRASFKPSATATFAVAVALIIAAWQVAAQSGVLQGLIPAWATLWACRALAAIFAARAIGEFRLVGFFKTVKDSPFAYWDTRLYSPLCVLLALGCLGITL